MVDGGGRRSVCSSPVLEEPQEGAGPAGIDWDLIRRERDEFAEIKWKGES